MKKSLLLFSSFVVMAFTAIAATPPDSSLHYNWNAIPATWDTSYKTIGLYNAQDQPTFMMYKSFSGGMFYPSSQQFYTYNTAGEQTTSYSEYWNGSAWSPSGRSFNTYDAQGLNISSRYENFNMSTWDTSSWDSSHYVMDGSNRVIEMTRFSWNTSTHMLQQDEKFVVSYVGTNTTPSEAFILDWNGSSYDSVQRYSNVQFQGYTGNDFLNNEPSDYETEEYQAGTWVKTDKVASTFTSGKLTTQLYFSWSGSSWDTSYKTTINYDAQGNQIDYYGGEWNAPGDYTQWEGRRDSIIYSSNNLVLDQYSKQYNPLSMTWSNSERVQNYYSPAKLGLQKAIFRNSHLYPNPAQGIVYLNDAANATIRVMDLSGKLLAEQQSDAEKASISLEGLGKGILLIQVVEQDGSSKVYKVLNQ